MLKTKVLPEGLKPEAMVKKAWDLLNATEKSSNIKDGLPFNKESLAQAKLVLGFLNATRGMFSQSMLYCKLINLSQTLVYAKKVIQKNNKKKK